MNTEHLPIQPDVAQFLALETRVWEALVAGDPVEDDRMLASDFLGVYPDGFADRAGHVQQLEAGPVMAQFDLDQARAIPAGEGHVMLCYRARFLRVGRDTPDCMYVSSLWRCENGRWLNIFSQDTPSP